MKLEQTSLAVLLWATFGGAMLTLVSTPADCLSTTLSALSEFGQQMVDPLSAEDGEAMPFEPVKTPWLTWTQRSQKHAHPASWR